MPPVPLILLVAGVALAAAGALLARASGGWSGVARRLGAAREVRVGDLVTSERLPGRPVRVLGRIRCADPLVSERDDRLVAVHRDVEVRLPGGRWVAIERLRETRGFDLWDHDGTAAIDPARAAEPLVTIPHVWRGSPDELTDERYRSAIERVAAEHGAPDAARAITRMVSVVERLQVLAVADRDSTGRIVLAPPNGGFVISTLELDDAMRLLAGSRRNLLLAGVAAVLLGAALALVAAVLSAVSLLG